MGKTSASIFCPFVPAGLAVSQDKWEKTSMSTARANCHWPHKVLLASLTTWILGDPPLPRQIEAGNQTLDF